MKKISEEDIPSDELELLQQREHFRDSEERKRNLKRKGLTPIPNELRFNA